MKHNSPLRGIFYFKQFEFVKKEKIFTIYPGIHNNDT